jgi:hypothetical protein
MKLFEELNEDVFLLFAARHYYNPICIDAEEFHEDLKRFKYVKRLISRFTAGGSLNETLILNHLIVIFNVFGTDAGLKMLEFRLEDRYWSTLKPFLIFLKIIPNDIYTEIPMNKEVIERLRKI